MRRLLVPLLLASLVTLAARGADIQRLVQETQRMAHSPSKITLVWWIPVEFWDAVLKENPQITDDVRAKFHAAMEPYMIFAVTAVDIGPLAGVTARERAAIEANTVFEYQGERVAPLASDDINPDAANFVTMMKPVLGNMLGKFGQGIEFLVYPNPPVAGESQVNATGSGKFVYTAFDNRFEWRLPIGSLLPPKTDPKTKETFPGDYLYNPYTGDKLTAP